MKPVSKIREYIRNNRCWSFFLIPIYGMCAKHNVCAVFVVFISIHSVKYSSNWNVHLTALQLSQSRYSKHLNLGRCNLFQNVELHLIDLLISIGSFVSFAFQLSDSRATNRNARTSTVLCLPDDVLCTLHATRGQKSHAIRSQLN